MWRSGSGPAVKLFKSCQNIKAVCVCVSFIWESKELGQAARILEWNLYRENIATVSFLLGPCFI